MPTNAVTYPSPPVRFPIMPLRFGSILRSGALFLALASLFLPGARAEAADETGGNVHTAWAASVRAAFSKRMHNAVDRGRKALDTSEEGVASWYGRYLRGHRTSSGQRMDPTKLTAAHRTLPLGSKVLVTSEDTGKSVIVTINDRGPYNSRIIDLSHAAAAKIGMIGSGTAHVTIAPLVTGHSDEAPMEVAEAAPSDTSDQAIKAAAPSPKPTAHH